VTIATARGTRLQSPSATETTTPAKIASAPSWVLFSSRGIPGWRVDHSFVVKITSIATAR
jgi:hypothetical protein